MPLVTFFVAGGNHVTFLQGVTMPLVTMLGLVGNILSILVLRSPRIDMKVIMIRRRKIMMMIVMMIMMMMMMMMVMMMVMVVMIHHKFVKV